MNHYNEEIEVVREALEKAHVALMNLNNKYDRNGLPKYIAEQLEHLFVQHMNDGQYFVEKSSEVILKSAIAQLVRHGYKVTDSEGKNY